MNGDFRNSIIPEPDNSMDDTLKPWLAFEGSAMDRIPLALCVALLILSGCVQPNRNPDLTAIECLGQVCAIEGSELGDATPLVEGSTPQEMLAAGKWLVWTSGKVANPGSLRILPEERTALFARHLESGQLRMFEFPPMTRLTNAVLANQSSVLVTLWHSDQPSSNAWWHGNFSLAFWNLETGRTEPLRGFSHEEVYPISWEGDWLLLRVSSRDSLFLEPPANAERIVAVNLANHQEFVLPRFEYQVLEGPGSFDAYLEDGAVWFEYHNSSARSQIFRFDLDRQESVMVSSHDGPLYYFEHVSGNLLFWNGTHLVWAGSDHGEVKIQDLVSLDVDQGQVAWLSQVALGDGYELRLWNASTSPRLLASTVISPAILVDGDWVYYSLRPDDRDGRTVIVRLDTRVLD